MSSIGGIRKFSRVEVEGLLKTTTTEVIGSGGQAACRRYRGKDIDWVTKQYRPELGEQGMLQEARTLKRLEGIDGVQQLVGVCHAAKTLVIRYAGIELRSFMIRDRENITTKFRLKVTQQLAGIVERVSAKGIHHNDIKGSNVCFRITSKGLVTTLIDFGSATTTSPEYHGSSYASERRIFDWIAPEVLDGKPSSPESDVYSLGILLRGLYTYEEFRALPLLKEWVREATRTDPLARPSITDLLQALPSSWPQHSEERRAEKRKRFEEDDQHHYPPPKK